MNKINHSNNFVNEEIKQIKHKINTNNNIINDNNKYNNNIINDNNNNNISNNNINDNNNNNKNILSKDDFYDKNTIKTAYGFERLIRRPNPQHNTFSVFLTLFFYSLIGSAEIFS